VSRKRLVSDADIDAAWHDADAAGSPDKVIARLLAAVEDPRQRGEDFSPAYAMIMVAELQDRYDRPDDAEATLRRAIAEGIGDDVEDPRPWLAGILVGHGKTAEAAEVFRPVRKDATDSIPYDVYGSALEEAGLTSEAIRVYAAGEQHMLRIGADEEAERLGDLAGRLRQDMGFPADRDAGARPAGFSRPGRSREGRR
jgi:predicted negative regulator of RcsB-dependent stress response